MLLAMALAVVASMAVALTVAPALNALLPSTIALHPSIAPRAKAWLHSLAGTYRWLLEHALRLPKSVLVGVCVLGLAGVLVVPLLGAPSPPTFMDRSLVVNWNAPPGTSLAEMNRITALASDELLALPQVQSAVATMGRPLTS